MNKTCTICVCTRNTLNAEDKNITMIDAIFSIIPDILVLLFYVYCFLSTIRFTTQP